MAKVANLVRKKERLNKDGMNERRKEGKEEARNEPVRNGDIERKEQTRKGGRKTEWMEGKKKEGIYTGYLHSYRDSQSGV